MGTVNVILHFDTGCRFSGRSVMIQAEDDKRSLAVNRAGALMPDGVETTFQVLMGVYLLRW